jgi:hypothetical protein
LDEVEVAIASRLEEVESKEPRFIRCALVMIRPCAAWRKTSVNRTAGTAQKRSRRQNLPWNHGRELVDVTNDQQGGLSRTAFPKLCMSSTSTMDASSAGMPKSGREGSPMQLSRHPGTAR